MALALCPAVAVADTTTDESEPPPPVDEVADRARDGALLATEERDCYELTIQRPGRVEAVDPLVPDRYTLASGASVTTTPVWFIEYHCSAVSLDGHPSTPTTAVFVAAAVASRDGSPAGGLYVLRHLVDNPELAARYRALGLPTVYAPGTTSTHADTDWSWQVVGGDLDHTLRATRVGPATQPLPAAGLFYHDGPRADLRLVYQNRLTQRTRVQVQGDLRGSGSLATLLGSDGLVFAQFSPNLYHGEWSSVVERSSPH